MSKRKPIVTVRLSVAQCTVLASFEMPCPLCKVVIPAGQPHSCAMREADADLSR